jgi:hypothetical protein
MPIKVWPVLPLYMNLRHAVCLAGAGGETRTMRRTIMHQPFRAYLITLALIAGIDFPVAGFESATAQGSQQLNLNPAQEQSLTQGLAN